VNQPALAGELRVEWRCDEDLRRYVRIPRLMHPATPVHPKQTPTLLEVRPTWMTPSTVRRSGFERVDGAECAQPCLVRETD
jgi:hypothetical protein